MIDERTYFEIQSLQFWKSKITGKKKKKKGTSLLQQSADQSPAIWDLEEVVHREIDSVKWNKVA